jgi:glycosidase
VRALALVLALAASAEASPRPEVLKVEPPSWWAGHSMDSVRLMIRGRNLRGAHLEGAVPGLAQGSVRVSDAGTYMLFNVVIDPKAQPGLRRLRIVTPGGAAEARFEILSPLPREGRFAGVGADDLVYLIMPDRFANGDAANDDPPRSRGLLDRSKPRFYHGGDLKGIREHLPYLKDLGVTALWLNPWYDNSDRLNEKERYDGAAITDYHGYGAVDFYGVDEHLGTLGELRALVDEAHALWIKVVQDQVANHSGPYHPWVQDPPTPTWYYGTQKSHLANTWQTWTLADPHAVPEIQKATLEGWFIDILPDLNQDDPETALYLIQNSLWWVGITGLDAIRQDTLPYAPRWFWHDWMGALKREYPSLTVVGEMFDADPALVSFFQGGRAQFDGIDSGVDSVFDFPLFFTIRRAFAEGKPLREVAQMLARDRLYPHPEKLWTFVGLHDVPRFMSETGASAEGLRLAFTFLLTARGTPMLYYGDEIALPGGADPDNRRDFPGGFMGDTRSAFGVAGRTLAEQQVFDHVRRLAQLRREVPALRRGETVDLFEGEQAWAYARVSGEGSALVALNNATAPASLDVPAAATGFADGTQLVDRLGGGEARVEGGRVRLTLSARSGAVYVATLSK